MLLALTGVLSAAAQAADLESSLRHLLRTNDLGRTAVAVCVADLDKGSVLAAIGAEKPMIPASNMKLLTTAAALNILDDDFEFRTELALIKPVDGKDAMLIVRSDGDPAFGDPILLKQHGLTVDGLLDQWVHAVRRTQLQRFDRLIIDDRIFDRQRVHETWPARQLHKKSFAEVAGINFHLNCLGVMLEPALLAGAAPKILLSPASPFVVMSNLMKTGKTDTFSIDRKPGTNDLIFRGTLRTRPSHPWQVTVHDPPLYFARILSSRLRSKGIEVHAIERIAAGTNLPPNQILHSVRTVLPLVLTRTNRNSQNLFAEALLKRIGHEVTGAPGSWGNGSAAIHRFLQQHLGARASEAVIADGSGLSRENRVSAKMLVALLRSMHETPAYRELYRDSLAYAGRTYDGQYHSTGTFKRGRRFDGLPAGRWVFGKSGFINQVSALSGYFFVPIDNWDRSSGKHLRTIAFSFIFNGFTPPKYNRDMKRLQEKMIEMIDASITISADRGV